MNYREMIKEFDDNMLHAAIGEAHSQERCWREIMKNAEVAKDWKYKLEMLVDELSYRQTT